MILCHAQNASSEREKRDYLSRMEVGAEIPTMNLQNKKQDY